MPSTIEEYVRLSAAIAHTNHGRLNGSMLTMPDEINIFDDTIPAAAPRQAANFKTIRVAVPGTYGAMYFKCKNKNIANGDAVIIPFNNGLQIAKVVEVEREINPRATQFVLQLRS